jgi:predicted TIM-barrel fold metal-dependent hydrolase
MQRRSSERVGASYRFGRVMLDGLPLIDAHVHAARLPTLKVSRARWAPFDSVPMTELYDEQGTLRPERFDAYLAQQGVDIALLFAEYSPRVTGLQTVEDLLPILEHNPHRFRLVANVNPYFHYPVEEEVARQVGLGAVALKVHPVHGRFPANDRAMYPAYAACAELGLPVIVHCGTSTFPGAVNAYGDPALIDEVAADFPRLPVVLAHGGRGWWYGAAGFLALARDNVWIELSGLPPQRLAGYYRSFDLRRLGRRFLFGSDWPGVPSIAANARSVAALDLGGALVDVLAGNAARIYRLPLPT